MLRLRSQLYEIEPYRPGLSVAEVRARFLGLERVVKLGSNESPFPPIPEVLEAIHRAALECGRYPDPGASELREALAATSGVGRENVVVGNGADELIRLLTTATLEPGSSCVYPWPGFPTYGQGAVAAGAIAKPVICPPARLDLDLVLDAVDASTSLVCIANPNNPTGAYASRDQVQQLVNALPPDVLCVIDEAYIEYVDPATKIDSVAWIREGRENICVLRTFSKAYGLAGLRIGYALTSPAIADALDRTRTIFNVNNVAQAAALAAIEHQNITELRAGAVRADRVALEALLARAGLRPIPSQGNFVFAEMPGEDRDSRAAAAASLAERLLLEGIIVRRMDGFGAPDGLRVTVGNPSEQRALAEALGRIDPIQ